jgi:acetyl-CoA synthetase
MKGVAAKEICPNRLSPRDYTAGPTNNVHAPPAAFSAAVNATSQLQCDADADRVSFWADQAQRPVWDTPCGEVLNWRQAPVAERFAGSRLNARLRHSP